MRAHGIDISLLCADDDDLPPVLAHEGVPADTVAMPRNFSPLADLRATFDLYWLFRRERPDIVHTNTVKAGLLTMLAAWLARVPNRIYSVGGIKFMSVKYRGVGRRFLMEIERLIYGLATEVWPNSRSLHDFILAEGLTRGGKVRMIGRGSTNGADLAAFSAESLDDAVRERVGEQLGDSMPGQVNLLFVGRLVGDKGIAELVDVFGELYRERPALRLWLVGPLEFFDDPLPEGTIRTIEEHPGIVAVGWSADVAYFMERADLFVFPSHREGFPNVLMQAGAMGLPIVCSDIIGNRDIVTDGETGLLFAAGDRSGLRRAIVEALEDDPGSRDRAQKLKNYVRKHLDRKSVHENIYREYLRLVTDK